LIRVAVADRAAYEAFVSGELIGVPGILRVESHLTMKKIKADYCSRPDVAPPNDPWWPLVMRLLMVQP
jgi:hypothetical protein